MGLLKSESLVWLDQLKTLRAQPPDAGRDELKKALKLGDTQITGLQNLDNCLDPSAIEKIRQAASPGTSQQKPQILSFKRAVALAGLNLKLDKADLHTVFHAALDVTLARRLATKDIKKLVIWVASGKPASEFDPKIAVNPSPKTSSGISAHKGPQQSSVSDFDHDKLIKMAQEAKAEKAEGKETTAQEKLEKHLQKIVSAPSGSKTKKSSDSEELLSETILLDWLADINVFKQIQSKRKKGKSLTGGEWTFLVLHKIGEFFGHLAKIILKLGRPFLKLLHWALKMVVEALKDLGLYKYAKAIFTLVVLIAVIWFTWEAFRYGVIRPVEMVWSKIPWGQLSHREPVTSASDVPSPGMTLPAALPQPVRSEELEVRSSQLKTPNSTLPTHHSPPAAAYQPAVSFIPSPSSTKTLYDPKILELEIAAIAQNSTIKDYVFQPDEGMPADLAVSRLQDLTDADKYTMMIGGGKQKILSVTPSNTNFIIAYKSTDLFGVFGSSSGTMNIFLEDVLYIHINETDHFSKPGAQPDIQYQCTVVAKGAKYPLTIQCASADDLENLVSTLEYFIRHSRLGHDAQPAGMPYPHQGLMLDNDCVVEKIWADSPADKAGIGLTDHLWSVGKETADQQEKKDFEKGLQSSAPVVYVVSPAEWERALTAARVPGQSAGFRPKLRKVVLPIT